MKKARSSLAVMGMLLLLFGGYAFPTIVTTLEDRHLQFSEKNFDIEKIELKTSEIDFFQELYHFPTLMVGEIYIQTREEELENGWAYHHAKESMMEFLKMLNADMEHEFEKMQVYSLAFADFETEQVYPVWYCEAVNQEEQICRFWIDEITEKILGFQIPADSLQIDEGNLPECIKIIIVKYYGFEVYKFQGNYMNKMKDWEGALEVVHNENKEYMYFPFFKESDWIWFNIYPGNLSKTEAFFDAE